MHSSLTDANRKPLLIWMSALILLVMLMVVVGGLTRLTDSGLSMVNWQPIHGILPPMNEVEWQEELQNYRSSPEYQQKNFGMSVEEFKGIFWLEYIHRVLGRVIGLAFALPFAVFLIRRMLPVSLALKYGAIFMLGGAQGLLGWYMVKSGLVNEPMVSPLRLSAHLSLACLLFCLLLWQWWKLKLPKRPAGLSQGVLTLILLTFIQIILGAWVAGLDAGLAYDSFPTMNGQWIPNGLWVMEPWWYNFWQNPTAAQFFHRLGALILTLYLIALLWHFRGKTLSSLACKCCYGLIVVLILQITLGALTLIHHVPTTLALFHQFTALLLLGYSVSLLYSLNLQPAESIKTNS